MYATFSILAILTILVIVANRTIIHYTAAVVLCTPLLGHAVRSIVLTIAPTTIIPQWMVIFYAAAAVALVAASGLWLAAGRQPFTLDTIRTRRHYASQARQRVRRRVRFVTQETKPS